MNTTMQPIDSFSAAERIIRRPPPRVLLCGPPGAGKTMVVRRMAAALPAPPADTTWIAWGARLRDAADGPLERAPLRAPHHTCSAAALYGAHGRPGEVSLAHGGLLLLDDAPEFRSAALGLVGDALRRGEAYAIPARPSVVVASAAVCPCGYGSHGTEPRCRCRCSAVGIANYTRRLDACLDLLGGGFRRYFLSATPATLQLVGELPV